MEERAVILCYRLLDNPMIIFYYASFYTIAMRNLRRDSIVILNNARRYFEDICYRLFFFSYINFYSSLHRREEAIMLSFR